MEQAPIVDRRATQPTKKPESPKSKHSPNTGSTEIILAKSHQQAPATPDQPPNGHSDQVEKALFDLQDVKNNYFQDKTAFD